MPHRTTQYTDGFYADQSDASRASAERILGMLFEHYRPSSIVDVGCGVGTWLSVAGALGVRDLLGLDGDYVPGDRLLIPRSTFRPTDLAAPIVLDRRFDLAISVEVAEHLQIDQAPAFVEQLTALADVVLFSAAIPYQGGTGHINEHWPEFWAMLFAARDYDLIDMFRPAIWTDRTVSFWYRQNCFLFVKRVRMAELFGSLRSGPAMPLSVVHPEMFLLANTRPERQPQQNFDRDRTLYARYASAWVDGRTLPATQDWTYGPQYQVTFDQPAPRKRKTLLQKIKKRIKKGMKSAVRIGRIGSR